MASPAEIDRAAADMASEWEQSLAAVAGDGQEGDPSHDEFAEASKRVLNQDEIDSLLGVDAGGKGAGEASGIQAIVNSALVSYERLPMLEVVFDRLVRLLSTSMRNFTSDNVEVSLDSVASVRFGDYLNGVSMPGMLSVIKALEWDNYGLIAIDSALIYSIVDVLLGGRRGTAAMRIEGRPYTTIERLLVQRMVQVVLADLSAAFRAAEPRHLRIRAAGDQPPVHRHLPAVERGDRGAVAHRHGGPWRPPRAAAAVRDARTGARASAADVHGREVRPQLHLGDAPGP